MLENFETSHWNLRCNLLFSVDYHVRDTGKEDHLTLTNKTAQLINNNSVIFKELKNY